MLITGGKGKKEEKPAINLLPTDDKNNVCSTEAAQKVFCDQAYGGS